MRITNNMIVNSYLTSFNKSMERQNKLQEQLTDGKAIHRPSDDPIRTVRSLKFNTDLSANEQFTQNVQDATSWMETTDSAMSGLNSIMSRVKELVVSADGTKPADAMHAIGQEIDGLIDAAIAIGNSQIGDRYIFSGQMDKTQPLTRKTITDPLTNQPVEVVVYNGDDNKISMPSKAGLVDPTQDSVNLTGIKAFGPASVIATTPPTITLQSLNQLLEIKNELMKATPDVSWLGSTGLQYVADSHDYMLQAQTELGARSSSYTMIQNMLEASNVTITDYLSVNEDLDISKAIIDFKNSESVYNAALSVGSKIMPKSLVDFLN
jgi:flagellar hook-associated protein 3 FlgL